MMDKMISISEAGKVLGVTTRTLKRWDEKGVLKSYRTFGNHRRYKLSEVEAFLGIADENKDNDFKRAYVYARVSTKKQADSGNLERQKERIIKYCEEKGYKINYIYEEIASGLNDKRRELIKMFRKLDDVDVIVIEYADRLARFGYTYLEEFAKVKGVAIEAIEQKEKQEADEEMVEDLISVITCFSARLYGARGGRKVKQTLKVLEKERQVEKQDENNYESSVNKCR